MRVALVCPYDLGKPGGVQDQVFRLRQWLLDAGHEPTVIGPGDDGPDGSVLLGSSVGVRANKSSVPIALDPRVLRKVRSAIGDVDVVHIHEPLMPMVSLAATRINDLPTVGTFHADASTVARRSIRLGMPVVRGVVSRLDVMTAVSAVAGSVVQGIGELRTIPNGVDVSHYQAGTKLAGSVVFLGRDDPRKGLDILLEAWPVVRAAVPDASLTVIGAHRDEAPEGVLYLGRVSEADKQAALSTASIYVAPNTGGESFGIVLVEAMASGCAVIASALPGFVRVVGDAGELVRPTDVPGLAERIVAVLDDDARRIRLGEAAQERAALFDGPKVANHYIEAYEDAVAIHGR
ncbi:MAG: glycosyltransferase family 4 protein [Acidimicrobiia bacterium]